MDRLYFSTTGISAIITIILLLWFPLLYIYLHAFLALLMKFSDVIRFILSARSLVLLYNTSIIALGTVVTCLFISFPIVSSLKKIPGKRRRFWNFVWILPIFIPSHIIAMVWIAFLGKGGLISKMLSIFHIATPFNIFSLGGAIFLLSLCYYPYSVLFILSGALSLDPSLEEAGLLNLSPIKVFIRIILPFLSPYVLAGAILVFVFSATNYSIPALLGIYTYPVEIFSEFSTFLDPERAILSSLPFLSLIIGFVVLEWLILERCDFTLSFSHGSYRNNPGLKSKSLILAFLFLGSLFVVSIAIPFFWLLKLSGSLETYLLALRTSWHSMSTTLSLAISVATLATIIGYGFAYFISRSKTKTASLIDAFSFFPLFVPGVILAIGFIRMWNHSLISFIYGSMSILILAYLSRYLPFSIRCLVPAINQVSLSLEESYMIYQRKWLKRQKQILFPLVKRELALAWFLVFALCLGDLSVTLLLIPPGMETLSLRIYNLMHYGAYKMMAALSVILISMAVLPLVLWWAKDAAFKRRV